MICRSCLRARASLRPISLPIRHFSRQSPNHEPSPSPQDASSSQDPSAAFIQPFTNPLSPLSSIPKSKSATLPISISPAGSPLRGINYLKGREDPVALEESEYPEWVWSLLDKKSDGVDGEAAGGDEFSKSKKLRQRAAKRARKLEAKRQLAGDMTIYEPKIPLTAQSVDLYSGEGKDGVEGALEAARVREELRGMMRKERRKGIKEGNFLKGM